MTRAPPIGVLLKQICADTEKKGDHSVDDERFAGAGFRVRDQIYTT